MKTIFHDVPSLTLLDSCAGASLVGRPWLDRARNVAWVPSQGYTIEGAKQGVGLKILGTVEGILEIGNFRIKIRAIASPDLGRALVLSWDLLVKLGATFVANPRGPTRIHLTVPNVFVEEENAIEINMFSVQHDLETARAIRRMASSRSHVPAVTGPSGGMSDCLCLQSCLGGSVRSHAACCSAYLYGGPSLPCPLPLPRRGESFLPLSCVPSWGSRESERSEAEFREKRQKTMKGDDFKSPFPLLPYPNSANMPSPESILNPAQSFVPSFVQGRSNNSKLGAQVPCPLASRKRKNNSARIPTSDGHKPEFSDVTSRSIPESDGAKPEFSVDLKRKNSMTKAVLTIPKSDGVKPGLSVDSQSEYKKSKTILGIPKSEGVKPEPSVELKSIESNQKEKASIPESSGQKPSLLVDQNAAARTISMSDDVKSELSIDSTPASVASEGSLLAKAAEPFLPHLPFDRHLVSVDARGVPILTIRRLKRAAHNKLMKLRKDSNDRADHELTREGRAVLNSLCWSGPWTLLEGHDAAQRLKHMIRLGKEENIVVPASLKHGYVLDALDFARGTPRVLPIAAVALKPSSARHYVEKEKKLPAVWIGLRIGSKHDARKWRSNFVRSADNKETKEVIWRTYTQLLGNEKLEGQREASAQSMLSVIIAFARSDLDKQPVVGAETPDADDDEFDTIPSKSKRDDVTQYNSRDDIAKGLKTDLAEPSRREIVELLWKYKSVLGKVLPGNVSFIQHHIELDTDDPITVAPYANRDDGSLEWLKEKVEELLRDGIVEEAKPGKYVTQANAPPKKDADGKFTQRRFCVNFKQLNKRTLWDPYEIPKINDCLHMRDARYFSKIDLRSGFWQVSIAKKDRDKTTFRVGDRCFRWVCMPMGMQNSPMTFQRVIDKALEGIKGVFAHGYFDDIAVYSKTWDEHVKHVEIVLGRLHAMGLRINLDKCEWGKAEILYLGHIVGHNKLTLNPEKIKAVEKMRYPEGSHELKRLQTFLGLTGYYRRFIRKYGVTARPLTQLLKKDVPFVFGDAQKASWDELKRAMVSSPILVQPDYNREMYLDTDASYDGIGGALMQMANGHLHPICFVSRRLTDTEAANLSVRELEALAVLWSIEQLREYLIGRRFTVITDHSSLRWMPDLVGAKSRIDRWWNKMKSEYYFDIRYRSGQENVVADALSRNPVDDVKVTLAVIKAAESARARQVSVFPTVTRRAAREKKQIKDQRSIPSSSEKDGAKLVEQQKRAVEQPAEKKSEVEQPVPTAPPILDERKQLLPSELEEAKEGKAEHLPENPIRVPDEEDKRIAKNLEKERVQWSQAIRAEYKDLISFIEDGGQPKGRSQDLMEEMRKLNAFFEWDGSLLHRHCKTKLGEESKKLVVPKKFQWRLIFSYHDDPLGGHRAVGPTTEAIKRSFHWQGMTKDIADYVSTCHGCAVMKKRPTKAGFLGTFDLVPNLWEAVNVDFVGPLPITENGNKTICTLIDRFSGWVELCPRPDMKAVSAVTALWEWICRKGVPKVVISDRGSAFRSDLFKEMKKLFGIELRFSSPYHPASNGKVERMHRTLNAHLAKYVKNFAKWDTHLDGFAFTMRNTMKDGEKFSPAYLAYGQELVTPKESLLREVMWSSTEELLSQKMHDLALSRSIVEEKREKRLELNKRSHDKLRVTPEFKLGDLVFIEATRTPAHVPSKYMVMWQGPYEVTKVSTDKLTYTVGQGSKSFVRHANNLMGYIAPRRVDDDNKTHATDLIEEEKKDDDGKEEKKKNLPLSPLLSYPLAEVENGSFLIVKFHGQRYLVQADSVEGDLLWVKFYRSHDAHKKMIDRRFLPAWENSSGEERWALTGRAGETPLWTQIRADQIFFKFSSLSSSHKISPDTKRRWDEIYGEKEDMCV